VDSTFIRLIVRHSTCRLCALRSGILMLHSSYFHRHGCWLHVHYLLSLQRRAAGVSARRERVPVLLFIVKSPDCGLAVNGTGVSQRDKAAGEYENRTGSGADIHAPYHWCSNTAHDFTTGTLPSRIGSRPAMMTPRSSLGPYALHGRPHELLPRSAGRSRTPMHSPARSGIGSGIRA